jgi:hypothetical protein
MVDGLGLRGCRIFGRLRPVRIVRKRGAIPHQPYVPDAGGFAVGLRGVGGTAAAPGPPVTYQYALLNIPQTSISAE